MSKRYNHVYYLGFSVDSDKDYPSEQELLHALLRKISIILDPCEKITLASELDGPNDTFVND